MAQIINLAEIREARQAQRTCRERQFLEQAVEVVRVNLAAVVERLKDAPLDERVELLDRVDKLGAVLRYGIRLLDAPSSAAKPGA